VKKEVGGKKNSSLVLLFAINLLSMIKIEDMNGDNGLIVFVLEEFPDIR
jgi:hypothetical protein